MVWGPAQFSGGGRELAATGDLLVLSMCLVD